MYDRLLVFFVLACLSSPVMAQELSICPVLGSEPLLAVEREQPYRLATNPKSIPGHDGLVVVAFNRSELYEIDGQRYRRIDEEFPNVKGHEFRGGIHPAPDGSAIGFGSKPRFIYHYTKEAKTWRRVSGTEGYQSALFDEGSGEVYLRFSRGPWKLRLIGSTLSEADYLPIDEVTGNYTKAVRTVPEIGGQIAITGSKSLLNRSRRTLWFRPLGGEWAQVEISLPEGQWLLPDFKKATLVERHGVFRLFPGNSAFPPLFFHLEAGELVFAGSAPPKNWVYHSGSQSWIGWIGLFESQPLVKRRLLLSDIRLEPQIPKAYIVRSGSVQAEEIPSLIPLSEVTKRKDKIHYHGGIKIVDSLGLAFMRTVNGLVSYDGNTVKKIPGLSFQSLGPSPDIKEIGNKIVVQSSKGVFILNEDLSVEKIENFPVAEPWRHLVYIGYLAKLNRYIVTDRSSGKVFTSTDLKLFKPVDSIAQITMFVSFLPDRPGALLIGSDRLYTLEKTCLTSPE